MKGIIQEALRKVRNKKRNNGLRIVQRYLLIKYRLKISLRALKKRTKE